MYKKLIYYSCYFNAIHIRISSFSKCSIYFFPKKEFQQSAFFFSNFCWIIYRIFRKCHLGSVTNRIQLCEIFRSVKVVSILPSNQTVYYFLFNSDGTFTVRLTKEKTYCTYLRKILLARIRIN